MHMRPGGDRRDHPGSGSCHRRRVCGDRRRDSPAAKGRASRNRPLAQRCPQVRPTARRLPRVGEHLFGREHELALLDGAWADEETNIISLVAWGGVGKSALVKHWLARMTGDKFRGAGRVYGWSFYSQGTREGEASADQFFAEALHLVRRARTPKGSSKPRRRAPAGRANPARADAANSRWRRAVATPARSPGRPTSRTRL